MAFTYVKRNLTNKISIIFNINITDFFKTQINKNFNLSKLLILHFIYGI